MKPLAGGQKSNLLTSALPAAVITLGGLAAYCNSFSGAFVFDDPLSITRNPTIRHLWPPWGALSPPSGGGASVEGRPILNCSLAVNFSISGNAVWSYHALNLLFHVLAGLTLFGIVRRTLARGSAAPKWTPPASPSPSVLALIVALVWTVHPVQTQAVDYVIQRAESLMGLFYLLTLYSFIRGASAGQSAAKGGSAWNRQAGPWYAAAVASCLFGMATKEVMASAPLLVLLYDRTFLGGSFREAWRRRRWVHLSLAATWIPLGWLVVRGGGGRSGTAGFGTGVSVWAYGLTQFRAIAEYLRLAVWPHPLVFEYGRFWVHGTADVAPWALIVTPLLAGTAAALWLRPALGFLGCWFFLILAPTSLVPGPTQMIVEHRLYLPLAALVTFAVLATAKLRQKPAARAKASPMGYVAIWFLLAASLTALTLRRNNQYRSDLTLWTDTVAKRPTNALAHMMLADALESQGRSREALGHYETAVRLVPDSAAAQNSLGHHLIKLGHLSEAVSCLSAAVRLNPGFAEAHGNLGLALASEGRVTAAIPEFDRALAIDPSEAEVHYNLGLTLHRAGESGPAERELVSAIGLRPDYALAYANLGAVLMEMGRIPESIERFHTAVVLDPQLTEAHFNLGTALLLEGRAAEAAAEFRRTLELDPGLEVARERLDRAQRALAGAK